MEKKKVFKKIALFICSLFIVLLPFVAYAQPKTSYEFESEQSKDENITVGVPIYPKVESTIPDKNGKKKHINYKATHKIIDKKIDGDKTFYLAESDIDVPIKIKINKVNLVQKFFSNIAYAGNLDQASQSDYSVVHQRMRLYWYYQDGPNPTNPSSTLRFIRYTSMNGFWYKDQARFSIQNAQLKTYMQGVKQDGYQFTGGWNGTTFVPTFTSGTTYFLESPVYTTPSNAAFTTWPLTWPSPGMGSGGTIESDLYDSSSLIISNWTTSVTF